jgi:hypothetical protein
MVRVKEIEIRKPIEERFRSSESEEEDEHKHEPTIPVGDITIDEKTAIQVSLAKRKGGDAVDIRTWISTAKYQGPTKKGVRLPVGQLDKLIELLVRARVTLIGTQCPEYVQHVLESGGQKK